MPLGSKCLTLSARNVFDGHLPCSERALLADGGTLMVHRPAERTMPEKIAGLSLSDRRTYGRSVVDFYKIAE